MCGRYALFGPSLPNDPEWTRNWTQRIDFPLDEFARYNIAPTQAAPVWRLDDEGPLLTRLRWGLLPAWAKDLKLAYSTINARAESIAEKPAFRGAWRAGRRCIVAASGWYEWQDHAGVKQPFFASAADPQLGNPLGLAGIWERWRGPGEQLIESFSIITTAAVGPIAALHDRMPRVLPRDQWLDWLQATPAAANQWLAPDPTQLQFWPVSRAVNQAGTEGPELTEAIELGADLMGKRGR